MYVKKLIQAPTIKLLLDMIIYTFSYNQCASIYLSIKATKTQHAAQTVQEYQVATRKKSELYKKIIIINKK